MDVECENLVRSEFKDCIERTLARLQRDPTSMPFHEALLSREAIFWSRFERSFSTSFGQRVIEKISADIARYSGARNVTTQKQTLVTLSASQFSAIENNIHTARSNTLGHSPNWNAEVENIFSMHSGGMRETQRVISDLYFERDGQANYFSIKTVKPNIDQTAEAKRDLLKLKLADSSANVYFGLYYNPFGEGRELYRWTPPMKIFNFHRDPCVLIGRDYWDTLGGRGTYDAVLEIAQSVSEELQHKVRQYGIDSL
ncbi:TdeIII family type II restriction endonuclease [Erwinia sorbitola]|uniref:type II site-specific deoxyribonuclease n=1 Tax=Erwinia sorbitola TaxID=2681984 RepID=A0A6I6EFB3_9GAMM|nr:TdeIII family type II restriction endonuclease [Erwinia sorbitola]MTD28472.1 TdeIII family type II restriction endonuclease [Erwinia sorbitola]QGU86585.1 TdeIII family type II restriction endonuclease [Erwinia sorbitola]